MVPELLLNVFRMFCEWFLNGPSWGDSQIQTVTTFGGGRPREEENLPFPSPSSPRAHLLRRCDSLLLAGILSL
eukprot:436471-Lingulodinium_polyedra.AAC.1